MLWQAGAGVARLRAAAARWCARALIAKRPRRGCA
jgi:hypothetical protein